MDTYKYGESIDFCADYYDMHSGNVYKLQEYKEELKNNPDAKIRIVDSLSGQTIGFAKKNDDED